MLMEEKEMRWIGFVIGISSSSATLGAQPQFRSRAIDSIVIGSMRFTVSATSEAGIIVSARSPKGSSATFLGIETARELADSVEAIARAADQRRKGERLDYFVGRAGLLLRRSVGDDGDETTLMVESPLDPELRILLRTRIGETVQALVARPDVVRIATVIRRATDVSREMSPRPTAAALADSSRRARASPPIDAPIEQANFPPTATEVFVPPLPMPSTMRGLRLVAEFDVSATGEATLIRMTPIPDAKYSQRVREYLKTYRFRPATKPDGTPIGGKATITFDF